MSYLVLHMDKFKKEAVHGIQSHNLRERKSHSNPDIDYQRSAGNYELLEGVSSNYGEAVQSRIDGLLLTKAVRHDAVHMCGLIVSSDRDFFRRIGPEETRRFFEESKAYLTDFVGKENVVSAMVHVDEKTPHMHFLHVPVTKDGRLNANSIYTRTSLKILQTEFHRHLHSKGFAIERGVEQEPGSKKKHLNTREFKQQQEIVNSLSAEAAVIGKEALTLIGEMWIRREKEAELEERLQSYEAQAQEAEKVLREDTTIPEASMFSFKPALEKAKQIIEAQKQVLANNSVAVNKSRRLETEVTALRAKAQSLEAENRKHERDAGEYINAMKAKMQKLHIELSEARLFMEQPSIVPLHNRFCEEQKAEAERRARETEEKRQVEIRAAKEARQKAEHQATAPQPSVYRGMRMGR